MATPGKQQIARLTFAALALSVPVATAAGPAVAANRPQVSFSTDASGSLLATVNRGENAIAKVECSLVARGPLLCQEADQLSAKRSTTYVVALSSCGGNFESACSVIVDGTVVVTVTLTNGATVTGAIDLQPTNGSAVWPSPGLGSVFAGGVSM